MVVLGDGANWIWNRAAAFLGVPGVTVTEIIDIGHVRQYLWQVANTIFGDGPQAASWTEPLSAALPDSGATPIIAALQQLEPTSKAGRDRVGVAVNCFGKHPHLLQYPNFIASGLPIGSGMVERACKLVIKTRQSSAGRRWGWIGSQAVASL